MFAYRSHIGEALKRSGVIGDRFCAAIISAHADLLKTELLLKAVRAGIGRRSVHFAADFVCVFESLKGGPGDEINPSFRPLRKIVRGNMTKARLEEEVERMRRDYVLSLAGGLTGEFDQQRHLVEVTWRFVAESKTGSIVVELFAYVVDQPIVD